MHGATRAKAGDIETLLKRANNWSTEMKAELQKVVKECPTCIRAGDPKHATAVSLSSLRHDFNINAGVGALSYGFQQPDKTLLHIMRTNAGCSEASLVGSLELTNLVEQFDML